MYPETESMIFLNQCSLIGKEKMLLMTVNSTHRIHTHRMHAYMYTSMHTRYLYPDVCHLKDLLFVGTVCQVGPVKMVKNPYNNKSA